MTTASVAPIARDSPVAEAVVPFAGEPAQEVRDGLGVRDAVRCARGLVAHLDGQCHEVGAAVQVGERILVRRVIAQEEDRIRARRRDHAGQPVALRLEADGELRHRVSREAAHVGEVRGQPIEPGVEVLRAVRAHTAGVRGPAQRLGLDPQLAVPLGRGACLDVAQAGVEVVEEAVALNRNLALGSHIDLAVGGAEGLQVFGSAPMLTTALSNLISNAITYSEPETRVGVSIRREGGMVELSVKDQGIGISKENLERVFERFFRVDKARSRDTGGSGLGLAIVKHIATDHGGQVTAWSMAGQGSTFTLHIPEMGRTETSTAGGSDRIRTAAAEQAPGKGS